MSTAESFDSEFSREASPRAGLFALVTDRIQDALLQAPRHPSQRYVTSGRDEQLNPVVYIALFAKIENQLSYREIGVPVVEPDTTHPDLVNTADFVLERCYEDGKAVVRKIHVVEGEPLSVEAEQISKLLEASVVVPIRPATVY